jgi:hypothetical protein
VQSNSVRTAAAQRQYLPPLVVKYLADTSIGWLILAEHRSSNNPYCSVERRLNHTRVIKTLLTSSSWYRTRNNLSFSHYPFWIFNQKIKTKTRTHSLARRACNKKRMVRIILIHHNPTINNNTNQRYGAVACAQNPSSYRQKAGALSGDLPRCCAYLHTTFSTRHERHPHG